jgi:hypothetical protein
VIRSCTATCFTPSNTVTVQAPSRTRTRRPISFAGTE